MITYNPASVMGIQGRKGILAPGKDADICIFDKELDVITVLVKGEVTFNKMSSL